MTDSRPAGTPVAMPGAHLASRLPKMLSARTVALRLGKRRSWVYEMCASGKWSGATRLGGRAWKIPEQSVLDWLASVVERERAEAVAATTLR